MTMHEQIILEAAAIIERIHKIEQQLKHVLGDPLALSC